MILMHDSHKADYEVHYMRLPFERIHYGMYMLF